jgi:hypothetical protein
VRCREVKINKGPYPTGVSGNIVEWGPPSDFPGARVIPVEFEGPLKRITYGTRPSTREGRHAYRLFFENDRVVEIVVGAGRRGRRR